MNLVAAIVIGSIILSVTIYVSIIDRSGEMK